MGLHSKRHDITRRARYSLGHIKMTVEDLDRLINRWETICGSVTIGIGDGTTADYADDLYEATKYEVDHLVIRTEDPPAAIALRYNKAEIAYLDDPQSAAFKTFPVPGFEQLKVVGVARFLFAFVLNFSQDYIDE